MKSNNDTIDNITKDTNAGTEKDIAKEMNSNQEKQQAQIDKMFKQDSIRIVIMAVVAVIAVVSLLIKSKHDNSTLDGELIKDYRQTVSSSDYIIHALGGMEGKECYINSIDCLEKTYAAGYRLFEADVSFTSDGVLVLAHSGENNVWSKNDWEKRLGQEYPFGAGSVVPEEYDEEKHLATYSDFMTFKIQGKYRASSFADLLDFMEEHTDMYVMVDAGNRSYEDTQTYYQEIVKEADGRTEVLDRLIAGGQTTDMVKAAREVYDFPLINLYYPADDKREEIIYTPEKFAKYCKENDIISFSVAKEVYTQEVAEKLEKNNLISYVFTVNDPAEDKQIRGYGADVIGTDYLWVGDE